MKEWKTKSMLALIWLGSLGLMGAKDVGGKTPWEWLLWAVDAGLLAGLAVTLRHYYRQIRQNAVWEYRRNLMWAQFVRDHELSNGDLGPKDD
jgi:hypothetical protein